MNILDLFRCFLTQLVFATAGSAQTSDQMVINGEWEVVFDWTTDRCNDQNLPDLPTRVFRDADGKINLFISHKKTTRMIGEDFDSLVADCTTVNSSKHDPDPSQFAEAEWISSVYTEDGVNIYALIHNEFQGYAQLEEGICPSFGYFTCWYNSITAKHSDDGGASFDYLRPPPDHLVANYPIQYIPDGGVFGAFSPSNIIKWDGYYYAFYKLQVHFLETQHTCLMRTDDLSDPSSWRFWNGIRFEGVTADPYKTDVQSTAPHTCSPVGFDNIAQLYEGISWNTYLEKFVIVGTSSDPTKTPDRYGFYYALSDDLINWDRREFLLEVALPWTATNDREMTFLYPTLIDHNSPTLSFETTGETAYLYFTRNNFGQGSLDRDLVRVEVQFIQGDGAAD